MEEVEGYFDEDDVWHCGTSPAPLPPGATDATVAAPPPVTGDDEAQAAPVPLRLPAPAPGPPAAADGFFDEDDVWHEAGGTDAAAAHSLEPEPEPELSLAPAAPNATPAPPTAAETAATVKRDRSALLSDSPDGSRECQAKLALITRMEQWLADEVGIGGSEQRYFAPADMIQFAWRRQLEHLSPDEIYQSYVGAQTEDAKRSAVSQLGITLEMVESGNVPASDLSGFAVVYGWVSVERTGKLYSDFKKYWAVLWREPEDLSEPEPGPEPEPDPGSIGATSSADLAPPVVAGRGRSASSAARAEIDPRFLELRPHDNVRCDKCGMLPIRGFRYTHTTEDVDLCALTTCWYDLLLAALQQVNLCQPTCR